MLEAVEAGLQIAEVDPLSDEFDEWYAVYAASRRHPDPQLSSAWQLGELRGEASAPHSRRTVTYLLGRSNSEVVVAGQLGLPQLDNLSTAVVDLDVLPERRCEGFGRAMLDELERRAIAAGRDTLHCEVTYPFSASPDGRGTPGGDFAFQHGFEFGLADVQRALTLPVAGDLLRGLAEEAATKHADYRLVSWVGPVPEELAESHQRLETTLMTEAPTGTIVREPEAVDVVALREFEATLAAQGRTRYHTVALDPRGEVVAYSDLVTTIHEPDRAYQWGTLVHPAHRGHRLGLACKIETLRLLMAKQPEITTIRTFNAEENRHMIAVNEQLGFTPIGRLGEFHKAVGQHRG